MHYRNPILAVVFAYITASCFYFTARAAEQSGNADKKTAFTGEIIIGATFPLTGEMDYYGQSAYLGAATRVRMINAAGGINGKRLVIQWRDNKGDSKQAVRDAEDLIKTYSVQAIIGPLHSNAALAVRDLARTERVVFICPMATSEAIGKGDVWVFRSYFSGSWEAKGMTMFQMNNFGARSCAILYDPRYEFSVDIANMFDRTFRAAGGKVVGVLSMIDYYGKKDYTGPLKKLSAYNPDFIYAPCYGIEAVELVHAAKEAGINIRFAGPMTWDNELVFDASGKRLTGTALTSTLFERTYKYKPFQDFYRAMERAGMDVPDAMAASAYDAISILAEGLKNGETSDKIREGIKAIRNFPLATGNASVLPEGNLKKPVVIRFVEQRKGRIVPIFAERYDPE